MTYHTVTLTTDQINLLLDLVGNGTVDVAAAEAIERELDSALLRHEQEVDNDPAYDIAMDTPSEFPDTCTWLMEEYDEDGPTTRHCGNTVAYGERRPLCPRHASAMDIPDYEFERRVEQGETWSR